MVCLSILKHLLAKTQGFLPGIFLEVHMPFLRKKTHNDTNLLLHNTVKDICSMATIFTVIQFHLHHIPYCILDVVE